MLTSIGLLFVPGLGHTEEAKTTQKEQHLVEKESQKSEIATFAGGCFWCTEAAFDKVPGVLKTISGYTGGSELNPSYEQVSAGRTGHLEATRVEFDPSKVTYKELLKEYWQNIDPTQSDGQFNDRGPQYQTAIFYHSPDQQRLAEESKTELERSGKFDKPLAVKIVPASEFYAAEEYHQGYHEKNAVHYKLYAVGSGRESFKKRTWGK